MPHRRALPLPVVALAILAGLGLLGGCTGAPSGGTTGEPNTTPPALPVKLSLLVVDDPALAAAIEREWKSREAGELAVQSVAAAELLARRQLDCDAVLIPPALLGELAESGRIEPPPKVVLDDPLLVPADLLTLGWNQECRWGQRPWAIPFGSPQLALLYRADLLARLNLEPPRTWAEYDRLAARLADRANLGELAPPADRPWHGSLEPQAGAWAAELLLARVASSIRDPSSYSGWFDIVSMEPLVAEPPFVAALGEMQAAGWLDARKTAITPDEARRQIRAGHAALAIAWPTAAGEANGPLTLPAGASLGIAELPGTTRYYARDKQAWIERTEGLTQATPLLGVAGRIGVVSTESRRRLPAWRMLQLLASQEWSPRISPASSQTAPFRLGHLDQPNAWVDAAGEPAAGAAYAALLRERERTSASILPVRLPGRDRYLAALAQAVESCRGAPDKAAEALQTCARQWNQITDELGRDRQRRAYRRSLGLED